MPIFDLVCKNCKKDHNDIWLKVNEEFTCPVCGNVCERLITSPNIIQDSYSSKDCAWGYHDENLCPPGGHPLPYIESRSQRKKLIKEFGLVERG